MSNFEKLVKAFKVSDSHHLAILAINEENSIYEHVSGEAFVSYRIQGRYIFTIGGVICDKKKSITFKKQVLSDFQAYASSIRKKIIALHYSAQEQDFFKANAYSINQLGSCYSINLDEYSMGGKKFSHLRNKISKARRKGIEVFELSCQSDFLSCKDEFDDIDAQWLKKKSSKALDFMVTNREKVDVENGDHRIFVARLNEKIQAYVVYSRSYGECSGWFHNLSRQHDDAPMGAMQAINHTALEAFKRSNEKYLHFGFTPMADLQLEYEIQGVCSKVFCWLTHFLEKYGDAIYPAKGQRQYKMSWRPQVVAPDYMAIEGGFRLSALLAFLKVTNSL